jgi:hypothetical protein
MENKVEIPKNIKIALSGGNLIIGDFSNVIDLNFVGSIPDGKIMLISKKKKPVKNFKS